MADAKDAFGSRNDSVNIKLTDIGGGLHAERVEAYPPVKLMTDADGPSARLRVDPGSTHFFKGRHYRTFRELDLTPPAGLIIKAVVPVNTILLDFNVDLISGSLKVEVLTGGVEGGSFAEILPVFPCNSMTEVPVPAANQVVMTAGGTLAATPTPITVRDVFRAQVAAQGNQATGTGAGQDDVRGVPPGTFYFRLTSSGSDHAIGVLHARWEERP